MSEINPDLEFVQSRIPLEVLIIQDLFLDIMINMETFIFKFIILRLNVIFHCWNRNLIKAESMALILDGNSEIDAHLRSDLGYLSQLIISRAVTNLISLFRKDLHTSVTVLNYHRI